MIAKIAKRWKSDVADSHIVTFVFILPLFFGFLVTIVDSSMYFSNRATIQQIARDGVRQAAIFGGPGTATTQSKLEQSYGYNALNDTSNGINCRNSPYSAKLRNSTSVECQVLRRLEVNSGLTNVEIHLVNCGVGATSGGNTRSGPSNLSGNTVSYSNTTGLAATIGDVITCQILWSYPGVPGSALAFIRSGNASGEGHVQDTRVTAQTETAINPITGVASR